MSNELAKFIASRRRHKTDVAIARQLRIAKSNYSFDQKSIKQPHRLAKHHLMDCGQPGCSLCGNPRHNAWAKKERLTAQERKLFQDLDANRDRHSNGLKTDQD